MDCRRPDRRRCGPESGPRFFADSTPVRLTIRFFLFVYGGDGRAVANAPAAVPHIFGREAAAISTGYRPRISIVSPAKDEQDTIAPLHERIVQSMEPLGLEFEIVFVDDGSGDNTLEAMRRQRGLDPRVRVIHFRRNLGKSAALAAAFDKVRGDVVVTIDADLQDDPAEIPNLLLKLDEGWDLVSGWKRDRKDSLSKRLFSQLFNGVVSWFSGIALRDFNCGLKAYRREVTDTIRLHGDMHRFIPVLAAWHGFRIAEIPVAHHPRVSGRSKYGLERIARGFLDFATIVFLTGHRFRPMHFFGHLGLWLALAGVPLAAIGGWGVWALQSPGGLVTMIAGLCAVLAGAQSFLTGLLAELIVYFARRSEPPYSINEEWDE